MTLSFYDSIPDLGFCEEWDDRVDKDGYAYLWAEGSKQRAARYLFFQAYPNTNPGLTIDHLCRNRRCVNLYHLEAITREENTRRALSTNSCGQCGSTLERRYRSCLNCRRKYMREYMRLKREQGYIAPSRRK